MKTDLMKSALQYKIVCVNCQHPRTFEEKSSKSLSLAASLVMGREAVRRDPTPKAAHERVAARAVRTRDIPLNLTIVFKLVFVLCRVFIIVPVLQCGGFSRCGSNGDPTTYFMRQVTSYPSTGIYPSFV